MKGSKKHTVCKSCCRIIYYDKKDEYAETARGSLLSDVKTRFESIKWFVKCPFCGEPVLTTMEMNTDKLEKDGGNDMKKCYLNGKEYEISREIIKDYIDGDSMSANFTAEDKERIILEVEKRMEALEVNGVDCQEYNFIEEKYTEACLSYIDEHNMRVEDLINEDANFKDDDDIQNEEECNEM
jgi:hypothetical protein